MKVRLHTLRFNLDHPSEPDEDNTALIHGVLELDGQIVQNGDVKIQIKDGGIVMVTAELIPDSVQIITHSKDTWNDFMSEAQ